MDYDSGNFYWGEGDHIYVLDDDSTWQKSSNAPTEKTVSFKFKVTVKFAASASYSNYSAIINIYSTYQFIKP